MAGAPPLKSLLLLLCSAVLLHLPASISAIGVNYGTNGNLPPPTQVANFLKTQTNIDSVKIFDVSPDILRAFAGTGISVFVTVPNGDIPSLANVRQARRWVASNISPFHNQTQIKYITVGNEILLTGDNNLIVNLLPAMRSLHAALIAEGIKDVKVTTAHAFNVVGSDPNGPPSRARFRPEWEKGVLAPILAYHRRTKTPFVVNPYPYFSFNPTDQNIINFAIFRPNKGVRDPFTRRTYTNMYDSLLDAAFTSMKAIGYGDVDIVIGETGWPSACDAAWCSPENAAWYNLNVIRRAQSQGTPLQPKRRFETYIFALFNEDGKPGPTAEKNWGLFKPDMTQAYNVGLLRNGQAGGGALPAPAPSQSPPAGAGGGKWCVAKPEATDAQLQANLDWACTEGGVDCKPVQAGGACFSPDNMKAHASYVMNAYYQTHGRDDGACFFNGSGAVTTSDPSNGACKYTS